MQICGDFSEKVTKITYQRGPTARFSNFVYKHGYFPVKKRSVVSKTWSYKEEEALIKPWPSYECLYKITSADYKRNDKRAAALEAIKGALEKQFAEETLKKRKPLHKNRRCKRAFTVLV